MLLNIKVVILEQKAAAMVLNIFILLYSILFHSFKTIFMCIVI